VGRPRGAQQTAISTTTGKAIATLQAIVASVAAS
jgi:hypothetical protein